MKAKKNAKQAAKSTNGDTPLYRLKGDARASAIVSKYPDLKKPLEQLASVFEVVNPTEARAVSGFVQGRIAAACRVRLEERDEYRKQQKRDRLAKKIAEDEALQKKRMEELAALNDELGISA